MKTLKKSQSTGFIFFLTITAILNTSIGCSKKNDYNVTPSPQVGGPMGTNEVSIQGSGFSPSILTVTVNTTVTFTNKDSYAHTVTSNSALFDSGNMDSGATFSFQFTAAGSYKYHCSYHSGMTGTIIVQ